MHRLCVALVYYLNESCIFAVQCEPTQRSNHLQRLNKECTEEKKISLSLIPSKSREKEELKIESHSFRDKLIICFS